MDVLLHLHIFIAYDCSSLGLPVGYSSDEGGWGLCEKASPRKEMEFCFDSPFDPQNLNLGLWADRCSGIFHHVSVCRHGWSHENSLDILLLKYVLFPICVHKYWEKNTLAFFEKNDIPGPITILTTYSTLRTSVQATELTSHLWQTDQMRGITPAFFSLN